MYTIQGYVKVKSLEEAYELNQKKSSAVIGGGMWLASWQPGYRDGYRLE